MDKFSGLKAAACIAAKNFERWSKLAALTSESSRVLHSITLLETSQLLSALLAELEAKDKRIAELEFEQNGYGYSVLEDLNGKIKRIAELEAKRATPVRLPQRKAAYASGYGDGYLVDSDGGDCFDRDDVIEALCEQGFIVEGEHVAAEKSE